jgi:hypothetical protein
VRRWTAFTVAVAGLLTGCGGSSAPFFIVGNDRASSVYAIYCTTSNCRHSQRHLILAGKTWRVTNLAPAGVSGLLLVDAVGGRSGCQPIPPALAMVDRLYNYSVSAVLAQSCVGYNPARPLGIRPTPIR